MPRHGLYEALVTEALAAELREITADVVHQSPVHEAEAADRLALHVARILERAIDTLPTGDRARLGTAITRQLISFVAQATKEELFGPARPIEPNSVLRGIFGRQPDGAPKKIAGPLTPLLDTTLLTNAPGEPRIGAQILAEIDSADRIDVIMAFIRRSGIQPLVEHLRKHCEAGKTLRILTTTYTNSTEVEALDELKALGADVRVSYELGSTRLHAKAWLFHRESGYSTAYIGSSNLTRTAQVDGLEWNVRLSNARNYKVIDKFSAVFATYWNNGDFIPYVRDEFERRTGNQEDGDNQIVLSPLEVRPEPFQERLLEQIELARLAGHHRNLLVSATGTGKTVMAALDYARLRSVLPRARLLFVAHREEILAQSMSTFRHAMRDHAFGELWVGGKRPSEFNHVFASIQSLHTKALENLDPAHFDVVIVDEFHHAAAPTYNVLLERVKPTELLGLTATPERSDDQSILQWFDGRIAAELRLWDAIDQHRLVPFVYYGIHDGTDLTQVPWRRGRGYDVDGLSKLLTGNDAWAHLVLKEVADHVSRVGEMRALGFCVSVDHARFMARKFQEAGVPSVAVWSGTPDDARRAALRDLADRKVNAVFAVDLFNEGVDVPSVDTILMLRPTESPTLFLQQLGRGLRRHHAKAACLVLDFIGHHRSEFRFDQRFKALLGGTRAEVLKKVDDGFPLLPAGCHMQLDRVAKDIILRSIRNAVPATWSGRVAELKDVAKGRMAVELREFMEASDLELEDLYANNRSWSDLCEAAGLQVFPVGPHEQELRRACGRLLHIDDPERINTLSDLARLERAPNADTMEPRQRRLLRMLVSSMLGRVLPADSSLKDGCRVLWAHPQILAEVRALLVVLGQRVQHVPIGLARPDVPLTIHARYTRIEILAAFGEGEGLRTPEWREGVRWIASGQADLLAFTLDKTSGRFSPTTRYRDYAISRELIHWESQSGTRANSPTGLRYQQHVARGSTVMLFARLSDEDRAFYFLGPATYVSHESELPMAVTWKLEHSLPGDLFVAFAAAVA